MIDLWLPESASSEENKASRRCTQTMVTQFALPTCLYSIEAIYADVCTGKEIVAFASFCFIVFCLFFYQDRCAPCLSRLHSAQCFENALQWSHKAVALYATANTFEKASTFWQDFTLHYVIPNFFGRSFIIDIWSPKASKYANAMNLLANNPNFVYLFFFTTAMFCFPFPKSNQSVGNVRSLWGFLENCRFACLTCVQFLCESLVSVNRKSMQSISFAWRAVK